MRELQFLDRVHVVKERGTVEVGYVRGFLRNGQVVVLLEGGYCELVDREDIQE